MSTMRQNSGGESSHLFQRLQAELAALISSTVPGERLTSEPELARRMGVSRATLREAMRTFEAQGLIRRRQGVGTFVVSHPNVLDSGLEVLESIETLARKIQLDVSMGALRVSQVPAEESEAVAMNIPAGSEVVKITRVILAEKRPVAFLVDVLPTELLPTAELEAGFTGSVLDLLLNRGDPPLENSHTEIQAVAAPPEIARALEIQRGDVLLMFSARLYDASGRVVDVSSSYFLPGYFRFHVVRRVEAVL